MKFQLTEDQKMIRDSVREFAQRRIFPNRMKMTYRAPSFHNVINLSLSTLILNSQWIEGARYVIFVLIITIIHLSSYWNPFSNVTAIVTYIRTIWNELFFGFKAVFRVICFTNVTLQFRDSLWFEFQRCRIISHIRIAKSSILKWTRFVSYFKMIRKTKCTLIL